MKHRAGPPEESRVSHRTAPRRRRRRDEHRRGWGVRQRLTVFVLGLVALGLLVTVALSFLFQYDDLTDRVDAELAQEVSELSELAQAGPARDGVPYTDAEDLFRHFLEISVAGEDEAFLGMIDGSALFISGGERPFEIDHPDVFSAIDTLEVPAGRAVTTTVDSQGTQLRMVVSDVLLPVEDRQARFVVVNDLGRQRSELLSQSMVFLASSFIVLLLAAAVAHLVLGRLLRPLKELQRTTAAISPADLSRRVDVSTDADADVAELAVRFNEMLDRIQVGVDEQRQFLDDAAHELRTPLTIVRGNTELVDPDDPEDVRATRSLVLDEVDRMQRMVDDLLILAKAQRPDFVRPEPTDVTELAVESMERISGLGKRAWRLAADAEGELSVDRHRIIQAVVQLAANAVKFSEEGTGIELASRWVSATDEDAARVLEAGAEPAPRWLALSVSDQGSGIPATQLARVFDRFGRADNAAQIEGSGLGLAIVSAIATAHGGAAGVESVEGVGSRFTVWVPDSRPTAEGSGQEGAAGSPGSPGAR